MGYPEGTHDQPADTKDRLVRVGTKYQATAPALTDGDNTYLLVDSAGRVLIVGSVAHNAADSGNPIKIGGKATADISGEADVSANDRVDAAFTLKGAQIIAGSTLSTGDGVNNGAVMMLDDADNERPLGVFLYGRGPDSNSDRLYFAGDSGPGLGAANVAVIGGDIAIRASAVAGEASGTSTAVDYLSWIKNFHCVLDVTAAASGGTPTLDAYLRTQLADGTWQDIAHFTQVTGSAVKHVLAWKGAGVSEAGTQAEAAAVTVDNYFTNEDAGLTVTTVRLLPLGDSMPVKWVFAAGGSTGDYTFSVDISAHR